MRTSRLDIIGFTAAGIAHDINNQLTLIVNYLSLADTAGVQAAVERCAALTASLLAYSRGGDVALGAVNPALFLRRFAAQIRLPANIELILNVPAALPAIAANSLALTRVLTNLVSNACAAIEGSGDGNGTLRIDAMPGSIQISDSGPGIPAEHAHRIFDPFFTTKGANGTGLGLSIVRELMRQQGGSVTMISEPGQGARFILRFRKTSVHSLGGT